MIDGGPHLIAVVDSRLHDLRLGDGDLVIAQLASQRQILAMDAHDDGLREIGDHRRPKRIVPLAGIEDERGIDEVCLRCVGQNDGSPGRRQAADFPPELAGLRRIVHVARDQEARRAQALAELRRDRQRSRDRHLGGQSDVARRRVRLIGDDRGGRHESRRHAIIWVGVFVDPRRDDGRSDVGGLSRRVGEQFERQLLAGKLPWRGAQECGQALAISAQNDLGVRTAILDVA